MPELMIDFITSLDGYGAVEGWPGTFDGRLQLLEYSPTVLAGPPGPSKADAE